MNYASKVLEIALAEVGYLEKKSAKDLDSKTANAGYNNYTKYGRDMTRDIGSPFTPNAAWCCTFVQWCFMKAYGESVAKKMLGGWTAYCPTARSQYVRMNRWSNNPQVGDQIFFKSANNIVCHTGLVYKVDNSYVYTIEGNTSGANGVVANGGGVCQKKYAKNYARIAGYGRPDYDLVKSSPSSKPSKPTKKGYTDQFPVIPPSLKNGSKGLQVDRLQRFLNWYGNYGLDVDGSFGPKTEKAVKAFQKKVKIEVDGHFGPISLEKAKAVKK